MEPAPRHKARRKSRTTPPSACCATSGAVHSSQSPRAIRTRRTAVIMAARVFKCSFTMIDSHVHLDAEQYPDPSGAIKRALYEGVTAMVVPGTGTASNRKVMDLARQYPGVVYPAIGFHPERYEQTDLDANAALEMIVHERASICAIGEVGLPWYGVRATDANV